MKGVKPMTLAEVPCKEDELKRLMAEYGTDIKRLCRLSLKDASLADDAAQETFIKAWKALDCFRGDSSERTWLYKIAVNTCHDMRRGGWFRYVDRRQTPEDMSIASEEKLPDSTVIDAVRALPTPLRDAVVLRYYEELPLKDTAQTLGTNVNTLNTRLRRARKLLEKRLEGWYFDE